MQRFGAKSKALASTNLKLAQPFAALTYLCGDISKSNNFYGLQDRKRYNGRGKGSG